MAGHFFAASCAYSMLPERNTKCRCTGEERLALAWPIIALGWLLPISSRDPGSLKHEVLRGDLIRLVLAILFKVKASFEFFYFGIWGTDNESALFAPPGTLGTKSRWLRLMVPRQGI